MKAFLCLPPFWPPPAPISVWCTTVPSMPQSSPHQSLDPLLQSTMELTDQSTDMDTDRSAINLLANHTRENTEAQHRARLSDPTLLLLLMPPTDFTVLMLLSPMEFTPSTPQLLLMLCMLLQLLLTPCTLPQLTMPQLLLMLQLTRLPQLRFTLMRFLPTPTPTPLPMTTQSLPSTPRSSPMEPATLPDLTPLLFPMAESNTSSTLPTVMMDMSLMSLMREPLSTQRLQHQATRLPQLMPQPQLTTLKSKVPQRTPTT